MQFAAVITLFYDPKIEAGSLLSAGIFAEAEEAFHSSGFRNVTFTQIEGDQVLLT